MAERLDSYVFPAKGGRRTDQYPWSEWLDGSPWRLKRTDDFPKTTARALQSRAYSVGRKRGVRVRVTVEDDNTVVLQQQGQRE